MDRFSVLIIDDNSSVASTLTISLERLGCRVRTVSSIDDAKGELLIGSYDALFVELCARGEGGGRGLARWIKSRCLQTACFLLTGWKGELEPALLRIDGIHGVIRKPLRFNEVSDEVLGVFG